MRIAVSAAASALSVLGLQVVALVSLAPDSFGYFSAAYLLGALVLSVGLSFIAEAWTRTARAGALDGWGSYGAVSVWLAVAGGGVAAAVCVLVPALAPVSWLVAAAVAASSYRASARYYSLHQGDWARVLPADILAAIVAVSGGAAALVWARGSLVAVVGLWAATSVASIVLSRRPEDWSPRRVREWSARHRDAIRPLLRDSLIMDAAAIGTPYLLIPVLSIQGFGVYRAVSNVAAPVRLILAPIRPRLAHVAPTLRIAALTAIASIVVGALATGALWLIVAADWQLGTLSAVAAFAVPTGLFVAGNLLGSVFTILARQHATHRRLLTGRIVQTLLVVAGPITGALLWGLAGAVWLTAIATVIQAVTWAAVAVPRRTR